MADELQDLRVRVDDETDLDEVRQIAQDNGLVAQESGASSDDLSQDLEPVTMLLIGGAVLAGAKFLSGLVEKWRGGLVIDQRPGATDDIHRDRDVPAGYVVVYPPDGGTVTIDTKDEPKDATERLIALVVSGAYDSATALAKAAGAAASHEGTVTAKS